MSIRISNASVSVVVRGYAYDAETQHLIWLELCPAHPKATGAIWASLVNGNEEWLALSDETNDHRVQVRGLGSRYHRLTADAPLLAVSGRKTPKLLRLIAPSAVHVNGGSFYVLEWPGLSVGATLAAMLEAGTATPIRMVWGDYLLHAAIRDEYAVPLVCGGQAPQGYRINAAPWNEIVAEGVRKKHLAI